MSNLRHLNRVLCGHEWTRADEWSKALQELDKLTEIVELERGRLSSLSHRLEATDHG